MTSQKNLIWIDLEMSGLNPEVDRILEIATIVTDHNLQTVAEGPNIVIHQNKQLLDNMGEWCTTMHDKTGLTEQVLASDITEQQAERLTLDFLKQYASNGSIPMCGNTVGQDRRFLHKYMPELHDFFHYRNIDVSTIKELIKIWHPIILNGIKKKGTHRAMDDIKESIEELIYYRNNIIKPS